MTEAIETPTAPASPRWRPLEAIERRVLGVLIEKAKTTPENYPLSINALRSGCNQKNNRAPLMQLEEPQVEEALDKLRQYGAIALVQGSGRVDRFRHLAYEWLGVEKVELAVMAELLLRGTQTVGELRGRAARMEPIKDLHELEPILESLEKKRLVQFLTPRGRGSIVTHALYLDREMDKVRREAGTLHAESTEPQPQPGEADPPATRPQRASLPPLAGANDSTSIGQQIAALREDINVLKQELAAVRTELDSATQQLRQDLTELNRQLGN